MTPLIAFLIAALIILPMFWLNWGGTPDPNRPSQFAPHVPAECRWMEIEQPGQWEQTCDSEQKRKF